jgi:hypothetical protein
MTSHDLCTIEMISLHRGTLPARIPRSSGVKVVSVEADYLPERVKIGDFLEVRAPFTPSDVDTPDLLTFNVTPGMIFIRRLNLKPMGNAS